MKLRLALGLLGLWAGFGPAAITWAAPQTFNTALAVGQGEFIFREQIFRRQAGDDPGPAERELAVQGAITVLGYGVSGDLALFGALPYLDKELELTSPAGARVTRRTRGLGDARLFGRYTMHQDDAPGRTFRLAPFLGVEAPTGDDDDRDGLGLLPTPLQLGSGAWDPFGGIVLTLQTLDYQIDAQASYQANSEANGFERGDAFRLDASLQYRVWPRRLGAGVPGFLYGVLEGNLTHQGKHEQNGVKDANSGGTTLFLAPGIQYVTRRWIAEAIVQLPVTQDLNGSGLEDEFTLRAGFRFNF